MAEIAEGQYQCDWRCPLMEGSVVEGCSIRGAYPFKLQWSRTLQVDGKIEKEVVIHSAPDVFQNIVGRKFTGQIAEQLFQEMLRAYKASRPQAEPDRQDDVGNH